jgi:hypothetical protein
MAEFIPTGDPESSKFPPVDIRFFGEEEIAREYNLATDTWRAEGIEFSLVTPVRGIPDPAVTRMSEFKDAIAPVITGTLVFDNSNGTTPMQGFFAVGNLPGFRLLGDLTGGELNGLMTLEHYGFATCGADDITEFSDMFMDFPFRRPVPNRNFMRGIAGFIADVPAGATRELPLALGWYKPGIVTLGKECAYYYTQFFSSLPEVLHHGLARAGEWRAIGETDDAMLKNSGLSDARQFLYAKAMHSYFGSTQLFIEGSRPRWVVNEGSCNMINTLDLTVDMAFFECRAHPWLLRNVLDACADEYSYIDEVKPSDNSATYPGGVSFTHDQGTRNAFSPHGYSQYEATNHPACFSYMTHEELLNWVLCTALYVKATDDTCWLHRRAGLIADCLDSMQQRDNPAPGLRNGIMSFDSTRCGCESEITTYDSLDPSLSQARNNTYMSVKCWAAYLAIEWLLGRDDAERWQGGIAAAAQSARMAAATVASAFDAKLGYIPAILEGGDTSAIIPIIEGLVYPAQLGLHEAVSFDGPFAELLQALKAHLAAVLCKGRCLFPDGGWKLSANSDNSWISKIIISQYVAEHILGLEPDPQADEAHDHWWRVGCARQSVVDQVMGGTSGGSGAIYPRSASCILWLDV